MSDQRFFLTFGSQYSYQPHPHWPGAHPDGWVEVMARDYEHARSMVTKKFWVHWSFLYPANKWDESDALQYYPLGCIATLSSLDGLVPA